MQNENKAKPFVETTVTRLMRANMIETHEETGIAVISGPWGIGKTTAIDAFAADYERYCAIVKIEPASTRRGVTSGKVMQATIEALRAKTGRPVGTQLSNATWTLRQMIHTMLFEIHSNQESPGRQQKKPQFTFIFDEAQHLSKEAIELLRYWNDRDRPTTPFPVGLIFVGNNEFAMAESAAGESVLSGAVRSRLTCEMPLARAHISDADITHFAQSRGITDSDAIKEFVAFCGLPKVDRCLRTADRILGKIRDYADDRPITEQIVREYLWMS